MIREIIIIGLYVIFIIFIVFTIIIINYRKIKKEEILEKMTEIPHNIFTSWHTKNLMPRMREASEIIKKRNPEFNYFLFDEEDCKNFILQYFPLDVYNAYNTLRPPAYKADLWRYCILYIFGGIYYDIKFVPVGDFKFLSLTDKEYFVKDPIIEKPTSTTKFGVLNGLIVAKPGNGRLLKAINAIVENVNKRYYGKNPLDITGPLLLNRFWTQEEINNFEYVFNKPDKIKNRITNENILVMYPEYRNEQKRYGRTSNYEKLYKNKEVYY